jgi:hypothetical protein
MGKPTARGIQNLEVFFSKLNKDKKFTRTNNMRKSLYKQGIRMSFSI